jgi:tetratricopeptide (TPR) repeat protein
LAAVEWVENGVRIVVEPADVDLGLFEIRVDEARTAGVDEVQLLRVALVLWRAEPLADVQSDYLRREIAPRLVERWLEVLQRRIELDLAAGVGDVAELQALTTRYPYREAFWAQLMIALYQSGRQVEALEAYAAIRGRLVDELGVDPGAELQDAHQLVLSGARSWTPQCQLPIDVRDFVDRDDELVELLAAFRAPDGVRVVTISGPPGTGKSALAVRIAHRLIADYPDGQWFLRLNGAGTNQRPPAALLAELLRTAGVNPRMIPDSVDDRAAMLRAQLADRRVLLVLDDAGEVGQVAPLLPGRPGSAVLVTSRSDLAGISVLYGGGRLPLRPLPTGPAYELVARIVGRKRCAEDEQAAVALTELCGRLPLALRIAAANLASRPGMGIGRYTEDLGSGDRLSKLRTRDAGGIAVRAAFDLSYVALDDRARRTFCLLGVIPGVDISVSGAAALLGCSADEAQDTLDILVSANLLENQAVDRYRFHDLLRVYAGDRARVDVPPDERAEAFRRLADWHLYSVHAAVMKSLASLYVSPLGSTPSDVVPENFRTDEEALAWLNDERSNYLAVIEYAAVSGPDRYTWLITDAARPDLTHLLQMTELEAMANLGLKCAQRAGVRRGEAMMYLVLGSVKSLTERYDESLTDLSECRRIATELNETGILATTVISMAASLNERGLVAEAAAAAEEGLELVIRGVEQGEARRNAATMQLALAAMFLGHPRRSKALVEPLVATISEHSSRAAEVYARILLTRVYRELGEFEHAITCSEQTKNLAIYRHVAHDESLTESAAVHCATGRFDVAIEEATAALVSARRSRMAKNESRAHIVLGWIYHLTGDRARALTHFRQGNNVIQALDLKINALAGLALAANDMTYAMDALALARKQKMRLLEAQVLTTLAEVHLVNGEMDAARRVAEQALDLNRESGRRLDEGRALTVLGHFEPRRWQEALAVFEAIGAVHAEHVRALLAGGVSAGQRD